MLPKEFFRVFKIIRHEDPDFVAGLKKKDMLLIDALIEKYGREQLTEWLHAVKMECRYDEEAEQANRQDAAFQRVAAHYRISETELQDVLDYLTDELDIAETQLRPGDITKKQAHEAIWAWIREKYPESFMNGKSLYYITDEQVRDIWTIHGVRHELAVWAERGRDDAEIFFIFNATDGTLTDVNEIPAYAETCAKQSS